MKRTGGIRESSWRASLGCIAAAAVAVCGLSALAFAPGIAAAATSPRTASEISTAENAKLGSILVAGNTVYTLKPSKKDCATTCMKSWLPVLLADGVEKPTAGAGVDASKLDTASAANHALQVTYAGKRLYWYVKDKDPGEVHGNLTNKWGKWSTVVTAKPGAAPSSTVTTLAPATTVAPQTDPAPTAPPQTAPPQTAPPETAPPATSPPTTSPPKTNPPNPPGGGTAF